MGFCVSKLILTGLVFFSGIVVCYGKQCIKNDDIGWREGNIYSCTDPEYPACCEVYRQFTCCEEPSVKNLREQLQLWGSLFLMMAVLFVVYLYYNKDSQTSSACTCTICYSCASFFKSLKYTFMKRKHSLNIQAERLAHGTIDTDGDVTTSHGTINTGGDVKTSLKMQRNNANFQYNSFEKLTVT